MMNATRLGAVAVSLLLTVSTGAVAQEMSEELALRIGEAAEQMQAWGVSGGEESLPTALEIATWYGLTDVGWYEGWALLQDGRSARDRVRDEEERTRYGGILPDARLAPAQAALSCRDKTERLHNATRVVNTLDQLAGLWAAWAGWYKFGGMAARFANPVAIGVIVLGELTLTARQYRDLINSQACWTVGDSRWAHPASLKS